ncbi:MAG: hypothetical protein KC549_16640 [Myxococcales bacterium]|nr:hypothetical protein [Myxococcales bacterium]MCB9544952.1 hypothetical protein [Myxococcales bacterium]
MMLRRVAVSFLFATPALAAPTVDPGVGIAGLSIGEQAVAVKLGDDPKPLAGKLGVEHGEHGSKVKSHDFTAGPLAIKAGRTGGVRAISVNLKDAGGLTIGDLTLPAEATLGDVADRGPECLPAGEQAMVCADGKLWFTAGADGAVTAHLGTASLATLAGSWRVTRLAEAPSHMLPRMDLKPGGVASIKKDEVRIGASRCEPKKADVTAVPAGTWLAEFKTDPAALGADAAVVFRIDTGCTDILKSIYAVGDQLWAQRDGIFYVFDRR